MQIRVHNYDILGKGFYHRISLRKVSLKSETCVLKLDVYSVASFSHNNLIPIDTHLI